MIFNSLPDFRSRIIDNERLVLTECLGQGAFGKVYCAVDRSSPSGKPKVYAVKCLRKPKSGSRQEQHQMREFALHERVSAHPNIVTFHKVIYEKDFVFVVLDYCDGGDLFSAITEQQLFDKNDRLIRRLFVQLIDAVHFCHDNNVCHRDLKPENILCSKDGRSVYLADFGLSTSQRYSTEYGCGSKFYMSPECIGKDVRVGRYSNRQSDVWSLGVIFINMVTGRNPWGFAETKDECFAEYIKNPNFLCEALPISGDANRILRRIFDLNPVRRITLPELRREVLQTRTFFSDLEALTPAATVDFSCSVTLIEPAVDSGSSSSQIVPISESTNALASATPAADGPPGVDERPELLAAVVSSTSSTESSGPITPETYAVDPAIEVPDMPLDSPAPKGDRSGEKKTGTKSRRSSFIRAFQRFKIGSSKA